MPQLQAILLSFRIGKVTRLQVTPAVEIRNADTSLSFWKDIVNVR